jgi:hypothetical protein
MGFTASGSVGGCADLSVYFYLFTCFAMGNMSYCRFRNTLSDLQDCANWMCENSNTVYDELDRLNGKALPPAEAVDEEPLDSHEILAMRDLIETCADIVRDFGDDE